MSQRKSYIIFISILTIILILGMSIYVKAETDTNIDAKDEEVTMEQDSEIKILPLLGSNKIGNIKKNEKVEVISSTNLWAFIQTDELTGWVPLSKISGKSANENLNNTTKNEETNNVTENISANNAIGNKETNIVSEETKNVETSNTTSEKVETTSTIKPTTKYIKTTSAYIREKASTDSKILGTLIKDTDVKVIGEASGWYKIKYEDISGYIKKDLIVDQQSTQK